MAGLAQRVAVLVVATVITCEMARHLGADLRAVQEFPGGALLARGIERGMRLYLPCRARVLAGPKELRDWLITHPWLAAGYGALALAVLLALAYLARRALILWHNVILARLAGTYFRPDSQTFPMRRVELFEETARRPPDHTFIGLSPRRTLFGWKWRSVYLSKRQRSTHQHVVGKTGSGKTKSVIWPMALQDALDGKGILIMDGKGSNENILAIKGIAQLAKRVSDLRVFSLPSWNQPGIPSHTYNMVHVERRTPDSAGGDPVATAERVFTVLPLAENVFYNTQAATMFTNVCRALHGCVDEHGVGIPFTMRDVAVFLKGIGAKDDKWRSMREFILDTTLDQAAAEEIRSQIDRLGHEIHKVLSGLVGAVDKFQAPLVNAYDPDIVMRDILENNRIVYVQLPANLYKVQAPALGKMILMDLQQEGSLRQVYRGRKQDPFSAIIDEYATFADRHFVASLAQLRDANLQFTIAHQSPADLQLVSPEFATAVWDNTRVKHLLNQDNPQLCELLAKSIGTHQEVLKTVRMEPGPLLTALATREASARLVESYKLHPNRIKNLARCGQGYMYSDSEIVPVVYPEMPPTDSDFPLPIKDQSRAEGQKLYQRILNAPAPPPAAKGIGPARLRDGARASES